MHVLIIGGGIGGLTLAHGLKKAGVSVAVYERDRTRAERLQGYRVHINPAGSLALHACLPRALFDVFDRSCGKGGIAMHFLTEQMRTLLTLDFASVPHLVGEGFARHRSVSRITLRQLLLSGLDDVVHFDKTFTHYELRDDSRVVAHFEDGSSAEGDVLVGADGGGSRVRRQYLPDAQRVDTGVVGIAGKVFLDAETRARLAPTFLDGLALVSGKGGYGLFVALQEIDDVEKTGAAGNDPSFATGDAHFDNTRSYLMWAFGARREKLGLNGDADRLSGEALRSVVLRGIASWDRRFHDLVRMADAETISLLPIRTSVPVEPWVPSRVTLLGDAIHSMTPYRGIGANIALKDALGLRDALVAVVRGERDLIGAIGDYETGMRAYGFRAVRNSLTAMQQTVSDNEIGRMISRSAFRVIDRVPALKRLLFQRTGEE